MNARTVLLTVCALALIALPSVATAQGHHGNGPGDGPGDGPGGFFGPGGGCGDFGPGMLLGRLADTLELTDQQRIDIEAIYDASRSSTAGLRDQLVAAREAYRADHELGVFDEAEARSFAATVTGIKADLMVEHMRANAEAFNVLTPEQQEELRTLIEQFGDLFGGPHKSGRKLHGRG